VKFVPFFAYYVISAFLKDANVSVTLFFLAQILEFWIVKNRSGWHLIGLTWFIEPDDTGSIVQFAAKPAPFVPSFSLSNAFWIGYFTSLLLWGAIIFIDLVQRRLLLLMLSLIGFGFQAMNLIIFMKAHSATQKEAALIARTGIMDDSIRFAKVKDDQEESGGVGNSGKFDSSELSDT
jgi:hypothetical protein